MREGETSHASVRFVYFEGDNVVFERYLVL